MPWQTLANPFDPVGCVYFIFVDRQLVYIGSTTDLNNRLRGHRSRILRGVSYDRITVKYKNCSNYLQLEAAMIRRFKPLRNKLVPRKPYHLGRKHSIKPIRKPLPPIELRLGFAACDYIKLD